VLVQVMLATGEGNLVYLEVSDGKLEEKGRVKLDAEVSCVDMSPLGEDPDRSQMAVVGTWDVQVHRNCSCQYLSRVYVLIKSVLSSSIPAMQFLLSLLAAHCCTGFCQKPIMEGRLHTFKGTVDGLGLW